MRQSVLILIGAIVWLGTGCDVITPPYTRTILRDTTQPASSLVQYRKVLIEEFTGAQCTNCPIGHRRLSDLVGVYGDSIVVVSIHAGEFARPDPRKGYTTDLRTPEGEELNTRFRVFAYPAAVINRTKIDGTSYVVGVQNWGSAINAQLRTSTPIAIETNAWCDTLRGELSLTVRLQFLHTVADPLNIGYYIVEDSIVAPQLDGGTFVADYVHRHVLRAAPLGAYGEPLVQSPTEIGRTIERRYTYDISQRPWNRRRLEVVVFIVRPEPEYTVVQCDGKHVSFAQK